MHSWMFAAIAAAGCALLGLSWAASLAQRVEALAAWARVLMRMEAGLSYHAHTLEVLLERSVDGEENESVRRAILSCVCKMRASPLVTLEAGMENEAMPELLKADQAVLSPLWKELGAGDESAQRCLLSSVRMAMDIQIAQAKERAAKNHRLAISLGLIGGGAVFLFLL